MLEPYFNQLALAVSCVAAGGVGTYAALLLKNKMGNRASEKTKRTAKSVVPAYPYAENYEQDGLPRYPATKVEFEVSDPATLLKVTQEAILKDIAMVIGEDYQLIESSIINLAAYVQFLPASEADHHHLPGGLLRHILEVVHISLAMRQGRTVDQDKNGLERNRRARAHMLVTFCAAVIHDIGKVLSDMTIACADTGERWNPVIGSLYAWAAEKKIKKYTVTCDKKRVHKRHEFATSTIANGILDKKVLAEIQNIDAEILGDLNQIIHTPRIDQMTSHAARMMFDIINDADKVSVQKDRSNQVYYNNESTQRRPIVDIIEDAMKRILKGDRMNYIGSTFAICKTSEKMHRALRDNANEEILLMDWGSFWELLNQSTTDNRLKAIGRDGLIEKLIDHNILFPIVSEDSVSVYNRIYAKPHRHAIDVSKIPGTQQVVVNKAIFDYVYPRAIDCEYGINESMTKSWGTSVVEEIKSERVNGDEGGEIAPAILIKKQDPIKSEEDTLTPAVVSQPNAEPDTSSSNADLPANEQIEVGPGISLDIDDEDNLIEAQSTPNTQETSQSLGSLDLDDEEELGVVVYIPKQETSVISMAVDDDEFGDIEAALSSPQAPGAAEYDPISDFADDFISGLAKEMIDETTIPSFEQKEEISADEIIEANDKETGVLRAEAESKSSTECMEAVKPEIVEKVVEMPALESANEVLDYFSSAFATNDGYDVPLELLLGIIKKIGMSMKEFEEYLATEDLQSRKTNRGKTLTITKV